MQFNSEPGSVVFLFRALVVFGVMAALASCTKKGGDGIVVAKEYIEAAKATPTPEAEVSNSPATATATPDFRADLDYERTATAEESPSQNPRAREREQWIVSVRMVADQRWIDVHVEKPQWDKLKEGDRVRVVYSEGKYTGTTWGAEIR